VSDERLILETIARCVAIMVSYYNSGPKQQATRDMIADVQAVAEEVKRFALGLNDIVERILHPVEAELFLRYGHELGSRMNSLFLMAFEGYGAPRGKNPEASIKTLPPARSALR